MKLRVCCGYVLLIFLLSSCKPSVPNTNSSNGWLFYLENDTLKTISIDDKTIFSLKHIPATHGQHHISSDGKKFLYSKQEKVDDSTYNYSIHILDLDKDIDLKVGKGYGGSWSYNGDRFAVFMEDSVWVYEYPSLKKKTSFTYRNYWRLCSIDWSLSDKSIIVFAYNRKPDEEGNITAFKQTKILLLSSDSLKILKEVRMDSLFTKRFAAINDNEFYCSVECMKCDKNKAAWHILKVDLSKKNPFVHLPLFVDYNIEDIAITEDPKAIIYIGSENNSVVISHLSDLDSKRVLIPYSVSLAGWSKAFCKGK